MPSSRLTACLAAGLLLAAMGPAAGSEPPPLPPCAGGPVPARTVSGPQPSVMVWHGPAIPENWQLASCSGLTPPSGAAFIGVSGEVRHDGDALGLLARLGTVSRQTDILYWNTAQADWRKLLVDASALSGPDLELRRPDFRPEEMRAGARLYMLYDDDEKPGPVVFETDIREAGPDGFVTVMRNVTPMTLMGFQIAGPGDISSMLSVRRVGPSDFAYYALTAVALTPMAAAMVSDASHINRAVASFRYLSGLPGDTAPPLAIK